MTGLHFDSEKHDFLPEGSYETVPMGGMVGFREVFLLRGILFEISTGMRLTGKTPKCSTIIKREYGFKGRPPKLARQLFDQLLERGMIRKEN